MIDGGIEIDLEAAVQNILEAEIIGVYFPTLRRTLLVDTRRNDHAGTFIRVVPMARSSAERLRSIRHLRPLFPRPRSLTLIPWEGHVESLVCMGLWEPLVSRIDDPAAAQACLARLCELERDETLAAITGGRRYETLWTRAEGAQAG